MLSRKGEDEGEVEYRYEAVQKGELSRSISATGQLEALTAVDVKSKAGGKVVKLVVDEGKFVKKGDLIALIDPEDTQASYDQSAADLQAARARADQALENYRLQRANAITSVEDAESALASAKIRLRKAEIQAKRAPELSGSTIRTAKASLNEAIENKRRLQNVTIPQRERDANATYTRTKAELESAKADFARQQQLLAQGYVSKATVEKSQSALSSAESAFSQAEQTLNTIAGANRADLSAADAAIERAQATLSLANANSSDTAMSQHDLEDAREAVRQAQINLQKAKDDRMTNGIRQSEVVAAKASTVRSQVSVKNAQVQLDSTTVVAPRDGVVTQKYLEEGTIIPPGTSTFSQGTSLVQLSDVTIMYVECAVDEADISQVKVGQEVRVLAEAYPGQEIDGVVNRISPSAKTDQNITSIKVRVQITNAPKTVQLLPGMNATCEFITLSKKNVLISPAQAIKHDGDKDYVEIKPKVGTKPVRRDVTVGETGNDGVEIVSGLQPGEEVVVAEIDLKELRETQKKMQEAQEGGGLAGGGGGPRNNRTGAATKGGAAGARGGAGRSPAGGTKK